MGEQGLLKQRAEEGCAEGRTAGVSGVEVGGVWCLPRIKITHEPGAPERGETRREVRRDGGLVPTCMRTCKLSLWVLFSRSVVSDPL